MFQILTILLTVLLSCDCIHSSNTTLIEKRQYYQPPQLSDIQPDYLKALQPFQNTYYFNSPPDVWVVQKRYGILNILPNLFTWGKNGRKVQEISYHKTSIHGIEVKDRKNETIIRCRQDNTTNLYCNCWAETCISKLNYNTWSRWEYYNGDYKIKRQHIDYFWKKSHCRPIQRCNNPNGFTSMKGITWRRVCHVRWNKDQRTCQVRNAFGRDGLELEQNEDASIE